MTKKEGIKVMVEGGAATPGPPLGPALGPLGVNAGKVVEEINKATASFRGMRVPVEVVVDPSTKKFEIIVGSPPTSALLIKALGAEKGGGGKDLIGDLGLDQAMEVAKSKQGSLLAKDLKAAVKEVVGNCQSLRISINGLTPKEMTAAIASGILDDYIAGKTKTLPKLVHKEQKFKIVGAEEKKPEEKKEATPEEAKAEEGKGTGDKKADGKPGDKGKDSAADKKGGDKKSEKKPDEKKK
jgi:large subunit ribosomal protein L11